MNFSLSLLARRAFVLMAAMLVAGCAFNPFFNPQPGMTSEQILRGMGRPTQIVAIEGGERYQYSQQPQGQYATMVDFDRNGHVTQARQVLTEAGFARIQPEIGRWTTKDIEREYGPPGRIDHVASWSGDIWQYRWRQGLIDMFYWVYFDQQGIAQRAHQGREYENAPGFFDGASGEGLP